MSRRQATIVIDDAVQVIPAIWQAQKMTHLLTCSLNVWRVLLLMQTLDWAVQKLYKRGIAQLGKAQHSTAQHSTAQHSTAQHSTAQHSTAQHSTAQGGAHSTAPSFPLHSSEAYADSLRPFRGKLTLATSFSRVRPAIQLSSLALPGLCFGNNHLFILFRVINISACNVLCGEITFTLLSAHGIRALG